MKNFFFKVFFLMLLVITLSGCYSTKYFGTCKLNLNNVQNLTDEADVSVNIQSKESLSYKDSIIQIKWTPNEKEIAFVLQNRTNSVISLDWTNVVYYDINGKSCRTMHKGVKFFDRNSIQPSLTLIPKSTLEDIIIPTDHVYFNKGIDNQNLRNNRDDTYGSTSSILHSTELFSIKSKNKNQALTNADLFKNKDVKILLPITYKNKTINYIFNFNISEVTLSQRKEIDDILTFVTGWGITTAGMMLFLLSF